MLVLEGVEVEKRDILSDRETMLMAFDHLGPIEQWLVCQQVQRLGDGQCKYGKLKDNDKRKWTPETMMEFIDATQYMLLEMRRMQLERESPQRDTIPSTETHESEMEW